MNFRGEPHPTPGDRPNVAHLEASGANVTIIEDDRAKNTDYSDFDLLFLSTAVTLSKIGDHFKTMAIPMVTNEHFLLDDNAMATKPIGQKVSTIRIVAPGHDLAASFTGDLTITTAATPIGFATPGPDAEVIAVLKNLRKKAVHFGYRTDAAMIGGYTAPARRVYFPGTYQTPIKANTKYLQLLDAAAAWALTPPTRNRSAQRRSGVPRGSPGNRLPLMMGPPTRPLVVRTRRCGRWRWEHLHHRLLP